MLAAIAHAVEVFGLSQKLQAADEELDRINKWFDKMQGMRIMLRRNLFSYLNRYVYGEVNS